MNPEYLQFETIFTDTVTLSAGSFSSVDFFHDDVPLDGSRVTDKHEAEIVKWMLADEQRRNLFFSKISSLPGAYRDSIPDKEFQACKMQKGGDIDLLILEGENPAHGVCVEFKKVKVRIDANGKERINNLVGLDKLVQQGNQRQSCGFFKSYICGVAVIDSHEYRTQNVIARGMDSQEIRRFYNLKSIGGVHNDVGIMLLEITQPTGKSLDEMSGFGICKVKDAGILEQPSRLTENLSAIFHKPERRQ